MPQILVLYAAGTGSNYSSFRTLIGRTIERDAGGRITINLGKVA